VLAYLGLGSNLGDRLGYLLGALDGLEALGSQLEPSPVYETEPVGGPAAQPPYLNLVARLETQLTPGELLAGAQDLERRAGRVRTVRFGPRTLDVDVLVLRAVPPAAAGLSRGEPPPGEPAPTELATAEPATGAPATGKAVGAATPPVDLVIDEVDLVVPHPRMAERAFVLAPLEDLDPSLVPPGWRERLGGTAAVATMARPVLILERAGSGTGWRARGAVATGEGRASRG
jgi:2-amino-4-hydroxy-6-hydroxymethyldihydropteridine diphosphokinase